MRWRRASGRQGGEVAMERWRGLAGFKWEGRRWKGLAERNGGVNIIRGWACFGVGPWRWAVE